MCGDNRKNTSIIVGLIALVLGVILGIFISPDSGSNNRCKAKYRLKKLLFDFNNSFDKLLQYIKRLNPYNSNDTDESDLVVSDVTDKKSDIDGR